MDLLHSPDDDPIVTLFSPERKRSGTIPRSPVPLILAPMAGVTDLPYRLLARRYGADLTVSEMVASQAMIRQTPKTLKIASHSEDQGIRSVQIAGSDPAVMAEAARMNVELGAEIIDINMGCPVKKIVKNGAGAALLKDETRIGQILEAVTKAVPVPITVKMRLGWDDHHLNGVTVARLAESLGVRCLTVHGRTRAQMYRGEADWQAIGQIKAAVAIPVIGNGDVTSPRQARQLLELSGVDGLMIGRGSYGRPWIFRQMATYLATGVEEKEPDRSEWASVVVDHFKAIIAFYGPRVGNQMARKHLGWYTKGLVGGAQFRRQINQTATPEESLDQLLAFLEVSPNERAA